MFDTRFISDYRLVKIINKCTLLIESPNEKPGKLMLTMQSQFQPLQQLTTHYKNLKQSMLRKELIFSGTEHWFALEDKLSTTTVVFFRSEGMLKRKCLYRIWKSKKCLKVLNLIVIGSLRSVKVLNLMVIGSLRSVEVLRKF